MVCHNHWTVNGAKISKSKGNYIPLRRLRQFVPGELVRAYLLTEDTLQRDGDFATEHLLRMTKDLADLYGNLLMRSLGKAIATPVLQAGSDGTTVTEETTQRLQRLVAGVKERYDAFAFCDGYRLVLEELKAAGQIATQYVDIEGEPTMDQSYNPNGSVLAIEGITSPDGRVFGKMGHSERSGEYLYKNVTGDKYQPIFEGGVDYFKI